MAARTVELSLARTVHDHGSVDGSGRERMEHHEHDPDNTFELGQRLRDKRRTYLR